jgi:hypothetical protein
MKNKIDIQTELEKEKGKNLEFHRKKLIQEVYFLLNSKSTHHDGFEESNINYAMHSEATLAAPIQIKNNSRVFELSDIKKVSLANKLKFADLRFYKQSLPKKTKLKCDAFQIEHGEDFKFMILTHASNFQSNKTISQKLLFAEIGNNEYFLIHKWGQPLTYVNKILNIPFRNLENMLVFVFGFALVINLITPTDFITSDKNIGYFSLYRVFYFFWLSIATSAIFIYYSVGIRKGLNSENWSNSSVY